MQCAFDVHKAYFLVQEFCSKTFYYKFNPFNNLENRIYPEEIFKELSLTLSYSKSLFSYKILSSFDVLKDIEGYVICLLEIHNFR